MIANPLADGSALLVLGVILGWGLGTDSFGKSEPRFPVDALALVLIPVLFMAAWYFADRVLRVYSSSDSRPGATLLWSASTGLCPGVLYFWLRPGVEGPSCFARAVFFTVIVLGTNLLVFNSFMLLAFADFSVLDILVRTVMDAVPVLAGVFLPDVAFQYS